MHIKQHIPNFFDGIEPKTWEFNNLEELLSIDWIKDWQTLSTGNIEEGGIIDEGLPFYRYSQSKHGDSYLLMAEWKDEKNHKWWVLGYLSGDVGLPKFEK